MTPNVLFELLRSWQDGRGPLASWANEVQWFESYADGRDAPKGIVSANWNDLDRYDPDTRSRVKVSDVPRRVCALFERMGVEIEWCDQVTSCGGCGRCIQTEPDSYSWEPDYILTDGDIYCAECSTDDVAGSLEACEGEFWSVESIDPTDHGYVRLNEEPYETGLFSGQTDVPSQEAARLRAAGVSRFLFVKDEQSQFYSRWSVLVHESEAEKARAL
jgi:hypothetical protein